jgi:cytochrome c5
MSSKYLLLSALILTVISSPLQATSQTAAQTGKKLAAATHTPQQKNDGGRIFQQNCSRCHRTPDGFSPRISGTIVRHMRVRASLSQYDAEELLRFFNP